MHICMKHIDILKYFILKIKYVFIYILCRCRDSCIKCYYTYIDTYIYISTYTYLGSSAPCGAPNGPRTPADRTNYPLDWEPLSLIPPRLIYARHSHPRRL